LNVSSNTALILLYCSFNQLTSLDIGNNTVIDQINCVSNQLATETINELFRSLPAKTRFGSQICIRNNPGTALCDEKIAGNKRWTVNVWS